MNVTCQLGRPGGGDLLLHVSGGSWKGRRPTPPPRVPDPDGGTGTMAPFGVVRNDNLNEVGVSPTLAPGYGPEFRPGRVHAVCQVTSGNS